VHWDKKRKKWFARLTVDRRQYHLGSYDTPEAALTARNQTRAALQGSYPPRIRSENPKLAERIDRILRENPITPAK